MVAGKRKRSFPATRGEANTALKNAQDVGRCNVLTPEQTREFLSALQRLAAANRTIGEAVDFLLSRSEVIKEAITLLELAERCAASKLACGRRPETTRSLQKAARQLDAYIGAGKMADAICRADIDGLLSQSGYAPKTRNNFLGDIASLWAWGRARGHVAENPAAGLDRAKLDSKPIEFLTVGECKILLRETRKRYPDLMGFIVLSLFAGIRPVELTRMSWDSVDLDARIVAVEGEFARRNDQVRRRCKECGGQGPYEIKKAAFDLGVNRKRLLDGGTIKYRADDRLYRKEKVAISCFHAMAGLDELFPNGGLFGTGFMMWGFNGTARVLIEYTEKAANKHYFLSRSM